MDSIITQVNREDEQLNAFHNDKGMKLDRIVDYRKNFVEGGQKIRV